MTVLTFYEGNGDRLRTLRMNINGDMEPSQTVKPVGVW